MNTRTSPTSGVSAFSGVIDPDPTLRVTIAPPSGGLSISGAQPGVALQLNGTVKASGLDLTGVTVDVGGVPFDATITSSGLTRKWTALVRFYRAGSVVVRA